MIARLLDRLQLPQGLSRWWHSSLLPRYQALAPRERMLVTAAVIGFPVALFVFGLWLPLLDDVREARQTLVMMQGQQAEAELLADQLASGVTRSAARQDLLGLTERLAREAGIRKHVSRLKPQPVLDGSQRLQIRMQGVPYPGLVQFLEKLAKGGIQLSRSRLQAGKQPGVLDVELFAIQAGA